VFIEPIIPGTIILAPEKKDLEKFYIDEKTPLTFSVHTFVKEENNSFFISNDKEEFSVENSIIIPFPIGESFEVGETVLTPYPGSKGFVYAYVLKKESDKYLVRYMNEMLADKRDLLDASVLKKLNGNYVKGAILIVKEDDRYLNETLLCNCNGYVLTVTKNGIINIRNKQNTVPIQFKNNYKSGDDIFYNSNGTYIPATVLSVNEENGTYKILFTENNIPTEKEVDLIRITTNLD
jgi:hypothetical protein